MKIDFKTIIIALLVLVILPSCYNAKKAQKQVNKALLEYPEKVATIARDAFPCITIASDTVRVTDTLLDFIDCPEVPDPEYKRDTIVINGVKTVYVKVPAKVQVKTVTVTNKIEDSAKLKVLNKMVQDRDIIISDQSAEIKSKSATISNKNKEIWIHRGIWILIALYLIYRLWRNITTVKIK